MAQQDDTIFTRTAEAAIIDVAQRHGGVFRTRAGSPQMKELAAIVPVGAWWVHHNLSALVDRERAIHVERGVYVVADAFGRLEPVAVGGHMVDRGYVSLWSAADHYGITTQDVATISVITDVIKADVELGSTGYDVAFHKTTKDRLFGYDDVNVGSTTARLADVDRLLIDLVWFHGTPGTPDAFQTTAIWKTAFEERRANGYRIAEYALRMRSATLARRIGHLLDRFGQPGSDELLPALVSDRHTIPVLPGLSGSGGASRWRVAE